MPALYSRLTAAALVGTALQVIADTNNTTGNDSENATPNGSDNATPNGSENGSVNGSEENATPNGSEENATPNGSENGSVNDSENATPNGSEENAMPNGSENGSVNDSENATPNGSETATEDTSEPTLPQIEVHVVTVTMKANSTVNFPVGTNVSELLATPETKAMTKTAFETDYQAALDATTSSSRRMSDDPQSPWKVSVLNMKAKGETQLDVEAAVSKSVDSASGAPTDTAKDQIMAQALAQVKTFSESAKIPMPSVARTYKDTTGNEIPTDFTHTSSVSDDVTTTVKTEMRDDPSTAEPTTTSTGGSSSTSTGGSSSTSSGVSSSSLVACVLLMAARFMC